MKKSNKIKVYRCEFERRFAGTIRLTDGRMGSILKHSCLIHHTMGNFCIPGCICTYGIEMHAVHKVAVEYKDTIEGQIEAFHAEFGKDALIEN